MSILRSSQLENWEKKWANNDLEKAYLFAGSLENMDNTIGYAIQDDKTGTFLFSIYDYEDNTDEEVEAEVERYENYILEKYKSYCETINNIRKVENANLYKAEKKFSRSVSF